MDTVTKAKRSEIMSKIRSQNTQPELQVRKFLHKLGFRFRLHDKTLPGKPDIVLKKYKTVVMVHGCFWHNHSKCRDGKIPSSNQLYWKPKILKNIERDLRNRRDLKRLGWKIVVFWECEVRDQTKFKRKFERCSLARDVSRPLQQNC